VKAVAARATRRARNSVANWRSRRWRLNWRAPDRRRPPIDCDNRRRFVQFGSWPLSPGPRGLRTAAAASVRPRAHAADGHAAAAAAAALCDRLPW